MKIIFDYQIFEMQLYGGVSRYFCEIANRIAATKGNEVEVFAPLYLNEYVSKSGRIRPRGIMIPRLPRTKRAVTWLNANISKLRLRLRDDVDIFHETYYSRHDCCPRSAIRILTVYDMIHEIYPANFQSNDHSRKFKELAVKRADHVICISENTQRNLIDLLDVPKDKTSVIHLGYSLTTEGYIDASCVVGSPYLLYVGNRRGYKNAEKLLRAYAKSSILRNNFQLVFLGGGRFSMDELRLMKKMSLSSEDVMQLSGGDEVLAKLYSGAAAFVYPSLYEGFGIPPLEAMSFNCPVVCSNTSSIPEVVGDAGEYFDPTDIESMRTAIERVVTSDRRRKLLIAKGRDRVKYFSWDRCAAETLDIYKKLV